MTKAFQFFIRPNNSLSDIFYFVLALIVGVFLGVVMGQKITALVGVGFAAFTTLVLFFMWRSPAK